MEGSDMKRLATLSVAMLLMAAVLATCGPPEAETAPDEVTVRLKWVHQAQFAGMYVAVEKGFYKDRYLAVNLLPFSFEEPTMEAVVEGNAVFGQVSQRDHPGKSKRVAS